VILRYFSIYGPRQRPDMAYNIFIDALSHGQPITIYGDGLQTRSSTYVADCVNATILALTRGSSGETYNIGGGEAITLLDAIGIIADALGVNPEIAFAESRAGDQRHTAADISRARAALAYEPSVVPRVGLPMQVEWQVGLHGRSTAVISNGD
jgi:nucleoside-diphosphate-sugar epimerase